MPSPVEVMFPPFAVVKNKFVELAVVEKRLVVVAAVVVDLVMLSKILAPVNVLLSACSVEEAEPPPQPVHDPTVSDPMVATFALKLVDDAKPDV